VTVLKRLSLFFNTLRYLKPVQIRYRLYYLLRERVRQLTGHRYCLSTPTRGRRLSFAKAPSASASWQGQNRFVFLNIAHDFGDRIDWDYEEYDRLWTYNLNYFEFLMQPEIGRDEGLRLIRAYIEGFSKNRVGLEPYPLSVRLINWIRFLSLYGIEDSEIDAALYSHYAVLLDNLEYHLLGNHLLENSFSLLFGGAYFDDDTLYQTAQSVLSEQLDEQVLSDGAHFELSPMYHQIVLGRLLDSINLLQHNFHCKNELLPFMQRKSERMLGWLDCISFSNGDIPLFNDSAPGVAHTTAQLRSYAHTLGIEPEEVLLGESGYRKYTGNRYELVIDAGPIGPDYQPGHGHCDMLSFVLYVDGRPCIVDTGSSTYEDGERRHTERATFSHNTVAVAGREQSEIWGAFRVARRARIKKLEEGSSFLEAMIEGFPPLHIRHTRRFEFHDDSIVIKDSLSNSAEAYSRFHFADEKAREMVELVSTGEQIERSYWRATGFHSLIPAPCVECRFTRYMRNELRITI
jgi:hypothetical protein